MFPVARDDGLIDVAIVKPASRTDALLFMDGAEVGKHFFSTSLRYFKVRSPSPPSFVLGDVAKKMSTVPRRARRSSASVSRPSRRKVRPTPLLVNPRLTPCLCKTGYIAIDGESVLHEPFQVEAHPRLARSLSLSGRLFAEPLKTRN